VLDLPVWTPSIFFVHFSFSASPTVCFAVKVFLNVARRRMTIRTRISPQKKFGRNCVPHKMQPDHAEYDRDPAQSGDQANER
jgi:hypothetical protein